MFTPNEQNLAGLENVCRDIRREETEGLKKSIRLHFVAANVPDLDDENGILRRQLQAFRDRLEFRDVSAVIRRYENLNLLDQSVFTLDRPHTRLARSYRRLLRILLRDNLTDRNKALMFLENPERTFTLDKNGAARLQQEHIVRLHKIARHFNDDVEILTEVGTSFHREKDYGSAERVFDRVLELAPANTYALQYRDFVRASRGIIEPVPE